MSNWRYRPCHHSQCENRNCEFFAETSGITETERTPIRDHRDTTNEELQTPSYMIKAASSHRCARCVAPALALAPGHLCPSLPMVPLQRAKSKKYLALELRNLVAQPDLSQIKKFDGPWEVPSFGQRRACATNHYPKCRLRGPAQSSDFALGA